MPSLPFSLPLSRDFLSFDPLLLAQRRRLPGLFAAAIEAQLASWRRRARNNGFHNNSHPLVHHCLHLRRLVRLYADHSLAYLPSLIDPVRIAHSPRPFDYLVDTASRLQHLPGVCWRLSRRLERPRLQWLWIRAGYIYLLASCYYYCSSWPYSQLGLLFSRSFMSGRLLDRLLICQRRQWLFRRRAFWQLVLAVPVPDRGFRDGHRLLSNVRLPRVCATTTLTRDISSGYGCNTFSGIQTCISVAFRSTISFTEGSCSGPTLVTTMKTVPFTTQFFLQATSTVVSTYQFNAPLFQLVHKRSDLSTSAGSIGSSNSSSSSSGGGLSTGGIVAIAVVVPIVVLGALIAGILLCLRRRKQNKAAAASAKDGSDTAMMHDPGYGIGYGKQGPASELDAPGSFRDRYGSDVKSGASELESPRRDMAHSQSPLRRHLSLRNYFGNNHGPSELAANRMSQAPVELEANPAYELDASEDPDKIKPAFITGAQPLARQPSTFQQVDPATMSPEDRAEAMKRFSSVNKGIEPHQSEGNTLGSQPSVPTPIGTNNSILGTFFSTDSGSRIVSPMEEVEKPTYPETQPKPPTK